MSVLFHEKTMKLLLLLLEPKQWYISSLAKSSDQSYVNAVNVISILEKDGIVECFRRGKKRVVKLTEKGEKVARLISELNGIISPTTSGNSSTTTA